MKELLSDIDRWLGQAKAVAIARVVDVEGSGPRLPGAAMAVNEDGDVAGSVSGGCVEGAVVTEALAVIGDGAPRLVSFGYSDDDAFAVGLTCGGTVHLFIEPLTEDATAPTSLYGHLREALFSEQPVALAAVIEGPGRGGKLLVRPGAAPEGSLGDPELDRVVARDALGELESGTTGIRHYGVHGEAREATVTVFIESFASPPRMLIFGAVDFTAALVRVAKVLGYQVTVCDPRAPFATARRFPQADQVVVDWPHRLLEEVGDSLGPRDAICVLTHDHKFDVPAVQAALRTRAGYLGAMGSRRTTDERVARLRAEGLTDDDLARVNAPVGLDIGARTPEETAVAICAEIIAARTGRSGASLSDTSGPLHDR